MSTRRKGREAALQFLYASDLEGELSAGQNRGDFWRLCTARPAARAFAEGLVSGVLSNLGQIDEILRGSVQNYKFHRIAAVDRNLLRLATYELLFSGSVPPAVAINEAIEIAKSFGGPDSGRFVNGILDRIRREKCTRVQNPDPAPNENP